MALRMSSEDKRFMMEPSTGRFGFCTVEGCRKPKVLSVDSILCIQCGIVSERIKFGATKKSDAGPLDVMKTCNVIVEQRMIAEEDSR